MILEDIFGEKLKVIAYEDSDFKTKAKAKNKIEDLEYVLQINPKDFSRKINIRLNNGKPQGNSPGNSRYMGECNETFNLNFTLDTTGVTGTIPYVNALSPTLNKLAAINPVAGIMAMGTLVESINRFYDVCAGMNTETHQPNFVKILWKDLVFQGRLKSFQVKFTQFSFTGEPVRAELTCTFFQHRSDEERVAFEDKKSPDLIHVHVVQKGDSLDALTHRYYGDAAYYLDVAKVNNLKNFRNLKPGVELQFPPLTKK